MTTWGYLLLGDLFCCHAKNVALNQIAKSLNQVRLPHHLFEVDMPKFNKFLFVISALLFINNSYADKEVTPIPKITDEWRFSVTPYAWLSGMNSTLFVNNSAVGKADLSGSNVLSKVSAAAMLSVEAHKGNWGVMGDLIYVQLNNQSAKVVDQVDLGSSANIKSTIFTGAATYTLLNTPNAYVDGLLGARSISTSTTVNVRVIGYPLNKTESNTTSTVDPIVGLKGRYRIADTSWYIPVYGDIGGGGGKTNVTWQAMTGIAKAFPWGDVTLAYRALYYDMGSSGVLQKTTMSGPVLGATFNF